MSRYITAHAQPSYIALGSDIMCVREDDVRRWVHYTTESVIASSECTWLLTNYSLTVASYAGSSPAESCRGGAWVWSYSNCAFNITFGSLQQVLFCCIEVVMQCLFHFWKKSVYCTLKWILSDLIHSFWCLWLVKSHVTRNNPPYFTSMYMYIYTWYCAYT